MQEALLAELTEPQKRAVLHKDGPLLVIAGPGSGKTRVITHRIAALVASGVYPGQICAITFTNKAADEMRQRAAALGVSRSAQISTFHSLCVRILREYGQQIGIEPSFSIYDEADQLACMKEVLKACQLDSHNFPPGRMLDAVSSLKNKLIDPASFRSKSDDFFSKTLAKVYDHYQKLLEERNALDFDDLLTKTALLLESCPQVRRQISERFRYLLIDEYQDTNYTQYRIAKAIASEHNNICATGDPDQSIYRWRGADIRNILSFEKDWPDATVVRLEENFRSTGRILACADRLIQNNRQRKAKRLVPTRSAGAEVVIEAFEDELAEAEAIALWIDELVQAGARLGDIAVFYRVNRLSRILEETFIRKQLPYQVVRGVEFYNRKEIRDVLAYLKVLANPRDDVALLRIINTPPRGIGKVTLERLARFAAERKLCLFEALSRAEQIESLAKAARERIKRFASWIQTVRTRSNDRVASLLEQVVEQSGLRKYLQSHSRQGSDALENVEEFINMAAMYDQNNPEGCLIDFLQQLALVSDADGYDRSEQRVALMTLHAAKGLEFDHVFIIGLEEGILPHQRTNAVDDEAELEEERRLLFVGMTRARSSLHLTYARYRNTRGQLIRTVPSQFLFELGYQIQDYPGTAVGVPRLKAAAGRSEQTAFQAGQLVRHSHFGLGRVKEYIDMGDNSIVVVRFNSGQTKSLLVKFASLSRV